MEEDIKQCECGDGTCAHKPQEEVTPSTAAEKGSAREETLFALLLALTPLAVFTFFGQVGLL